MANKVYPTPPKPGIKQLGKLDKLAKERRQRVAQVQTNMAHIVQQFVLRPTKTGRIPLQHFWNESHQNPKFELIRAVAEIYLDIQCELDVVWIDDTMTERVLFVRR